jgi:hypothetical protein
MERLEGAEIPCDVSGMEMLLRSLDPWDKVLNIPCWFPFMWETILSYGSTYNAAVLSRISEAKWTFEQHYPLKAH